MCAVWRTGMIDSLRAAFVVSVSPNETPLQAPQTWLGLMLIVCVSMSAGFFVSRGGARRSFWILGLGFLTAAAGSLLASRFLKIDILFAPQALGAISSVVIVQLYRLWRIDSLLTDRVNKTSQNLIQATVAPARLSNALKLLQTVLPLDEAVVFQPNDLGELVPCAQLRATAGGALEAGRNSLWRVLVQLCDRALQTNEIALAPAGNVVCTA